MSKLLSVTSTSVLWLLEVAEDIVSCSTAASTGKRVQTSECQSIKKLWADEFVFLLGGPRLTFSRNMNPVI